jgi:polysaccharide deacetylase 2 family uncharacterized protein YibQ
LLLLGFILMVAGVAVWLTLSSPDLPSTQAKYAQPSQTDGDNVKGGIGLDKAPTPQMAKQKLPVKATKLAPSVKPVKPVKDIAAAETPHLPASPVKHKAEKHGAEKHGAVPDKRPDTHPPPSFAGKNSSPAATPAQPAATPTLTRKRPDRPIMPKRLPPAPRDAPLSPSPDPSLVQVTALGPPPRISSDGRMPRLVYAKPFNPADKRPRIGIVVTGLGLSAAATESAIQGLPGSVTLAFAPYSSRLNEWIRLARAAGHEVLINVPMEPDNYPAYDPGPQTLLTSMTDAQNLDRLLWILSRGTGYVGVVDFLGSRFTTSRKHMRPILAALQERGLLYLDSGSSPRSISPVVAGQLNLSWAAVSLTLDQRASRTEIDRNFALLEQRAKREQRAIGIASPYPVSLERIATWARQLEARGIAIAPITAIAAVKTRTRKK